LRPSGILTSEPGINTAFTLIGEHDVEPFRSARAIMRNKVEPAKGK
jgi:hypothetical protein